MFNLEQLIWLVTLTTINNLLWLEQISLVSIRLLDLFGFDFQGINQELLVFLFFVFFVWQDGGELFFLGLPNTAIFSKLSGLPERSPTTHYPLHLLFLENLWWEGGCSGMFSCMLRLFLKCFPKKLGNKHWGCHYCGELKNKRTAGVFAVLGAVTFRIPLPKVK